MSCAHDELGRLWGTLSAELKLNILGYVLNVDVEPPNPQKSIYAPRIDKTKFDTLLKQDLLPYFSEKFECAGKDYREQLICVDSANEVFGRICQRSVLQEQHLLHRGQAL
jgi:hypothetical protein